MNTFKNKLKNINILLVLIGIIFSISSSILSFQLIITNHYSQYNIIFTCIISFVCSAIYFLKSYKKIFKIIKKDKLITIIAMIVSFIVLKELYLSKALALKPLFLESPINLFRLRYFSLSFISLSYIFINILYILKKYIKSFVNSLSKWDKKAYLIATIIATFIIVISYCTNQKWFLQFDDVYSMDSGLVFDYIIPKSATFYDIRHPLISIIIFPVYSIFSTILKVFVGNNMNLFKVMLAILFQLINSQALILVGLLLKKLTNNKITFIIYMISFPTILHVLFLEKFQICVFFLVLYVYTICTKKDKSIPSFIISAGTILTSVYIGICELLVKDEFKNKLKKIFKIILMTILCFICLGRAHMLVHGINEITNMTKEFSGENLSFLQNTIATLKTIQNCIFALPSGVNNLGLFFWIDLHNNISILSIIILIIVFIGSIVKRKDLFIKISTSWLVFIFILFLIVKWSTHTAPLFSIYFSWAIIPLFIAGLDFVIKKCKLNRKIVYSLLIFMIEIYNFLKI